MKPCYGCRDRRPGCAGGCGEYHAWMRGLREDPEELRRQRSIDGYVISREIARWR